MKGKIYRESGILDKPLEGVCSWLDGTTDLRSCMQAIGICGKYRSVSEGKRVHWYIARNGLGQNLDLGNHFVNMYSNCGSLEYALRAFHDLPERNAFSWTAAMRACSQNGHAREALLLFNKMQEDGVMPDRVAFITIASVCANLGALREGRLIHGSIIEEKMDEDMMLSTALLDMYRKCGSFDEACAVFDSIKIANAFAYTSMIALYIQKEGLMEALKVFKAMLLEGFCPDRITFVTLLEGCTQSVVEGRKIHGYIIASGLEQDVMVGTAVIDMYGKCGNLEDARRVFDKLRRRNVVSWTAMIAGYVLWERGDEALNLFDLMTTQGVKPDRITCVSALNACRCQADYERVHQKVLELGLESDPNLKSALVSMYCRWGRLEEAEKILNDIDKREVVLWTAMFAACAEHRCPSKQSILLFWKMLLEGVYAHISTFVTLLETCISLADLPYGKLIHACLVEAGYESNVVGATALVNMYAKCGSLVAARKLFDIFEHKDVVLWTAMLAAYAHHGDGEEVAKLFVEMHQDKVKPNHVTFISILSACSHGGLVEEAEGYFKAMVEDYEIVPKSEHYGCMIHVYGRTGRLNEAENFISKMPSADIVAWRTLLSACKDHGDLIRGKRAAEHICELTKLRSD